MCTWTFIEDSTSEGKKLGNVVEMEILNLGGGRKTVLKTANHS